MVWKHKTRSFFECCILHNYLIGVDPDDTLLAQVDIELGDEL